MKINFVWVCRCFVAILFFASAVLKLLPIQAFEKTISESAYVSDSWSPLIARIVVIIEIVLAVLLIQKNLLKKYVVTSSILLLLFFCVHLVVKWVSSGNVGSCGCMGELLPMTPVEALIKNAVTLLLLFYLYRNLPEDKVNTKKSLVTILSALIVSGVSVMIAFPLPKEREMVTDTELELMFSTTCDHCLETAKQLAVYKLSNKLPPIKIVFSSLDMESTGATLQAEIDSFLSVSGLTCGLDTALCKYEVLSPIKFLDAVDQGPPRVTLWSEGRMVIDLQGEDEFSIDSLRMGLNKIQY